MRSPLGFWTRAPQARRTLLFASATHVWSDLFFALYAPLLPLIKKDLDLSFTEVGMLRSLYSAASTVLQVPVGFLAERVGEFWLLVGGNVWVALGLIGMSLAPGFAALLGATLLGGLGGGTQHPLASGIVSRAYDTKSRATAVGTVNFAGDLGKMAAPAVALIVAVAYGWRETMLFIGIAAVAFFLASTLVRRSVDIGRPEPAEAKQASGGSDGTTAGFRILSAVGFIDSGIRAAALTFVPFILADRGMEESLIFVMLILLLAGGALGKYVCGWLSERHGLISIVWATKATAAVAPGRDRRRADGHDSASDGAARRRAERDVVVPLRHRRRLHAPGAALPHVRLLLHHQLYRGVHRAARLRASGGLVRHPRQHGPHGALRRNRPARQPRPPGIPSPRAGAGGRRKRGAVR